MVYIKKVVCNKSELPVALAQLSSWRGPKTGKSFSIITIYFPAHPKHKAAGLADDKVLIIARS
jgi:hypothetical protein